MIQIYKPTNTNYDKNGDIVLTPTVCEAPAELGGSWSLNITHPIDDEGRWKYIVNEAVISVPTFMGENQLYRIESIDEKTTEEITATAYPIFFDSGDDCFLLDTRPTGKNGQEALNEMTKGTKYSGSSDITKVGTAYFVRKNLMDALNGDSPSFTEIWGGEPLYDNFNVIMNERAGGDYGVEIRYGLNMDSISVNEDFSEVVTRIVPVAYNGYTYSKNFVDSPLINKYAKIYTREIKFEDIKMRKDASEGDEKDGIIICDNQEQLDAALLQKCQEQFELGIDKFKVTMDIKMIDLVGTEEYKDFEEIVKVGLGDTAHCYNYDLEVNTSARVIKIVWDCIDNEIKEVTLGDYQTNIFDDFSNAANKIESIFNPDGSVMAEKVKGVINAINTVIKLQSTVAKPVSGIAFKVEILDESSPFYGCMIWGTQGIQISKRRTADGRDWDWTTAMTASGFVADAIIAGVLSDKLGRNFWNLDTGEFQLSAIGTFVDGETLDKYVNGYVDEFGKTLTQEDIFNRLTNNGEVQSIYLKNGKLYINADYIKAGTLVADLIKAGVLSDSNGKNRWDFNNSIFRLDGNVSMNVTGQKDFVYLEYDSNDYGRLRDILDEKITPTVEDYEKYDIDGNGRLTASDFVKVNKLVMQQVEKYSLSLQLGINGNSQSGMIKTRNVFIGLDGIHSKNIDCESIYSKEFLVSDPSNPSAELKGVTQDINIGGVILRIVNGIVIGVI